MRNRIKGFRKIKENSTNRFMRVKSRKPRIDNRNKSSFSGETGAETILRVGEEIIRQTKIIQKIKNMTLEDLTYNGQQRNRTEIFWRGRVRSRFRDRNNESIFPIFWKRARGDRRIEDQRKGESNRESSIVEHLSRNIVRTRSGI